MAAACTARDGDFASDRELSRRSSGSRDRTPGRLHLRALWPRSARRVFGPLLALSLRPAFRCCQGLCLLAGPSPPSWLLRRKPRPGNGKLPRRPALPVGFVVSVDEGQGHTGPSNLCKAGCFCYLSNRKSASGDFVATGSKRLL